VAAVQLGVSVPTLYDWKARGCPWKKGGSFPLEEMKAWHESSVRTTKPTIGAKKERSEDDHVGDLGFSVRKVRADALLAETKWKKEAGKLVYAQEVLQQISQVVIEMQTMMKQIPSRVAGQIDEPERKRATQEQLTVMIDDICETCSRSLEKTVREILEEVVD
jgi:phage terminase Nu1 subunit (DNA packaging protein)